MSELTNEQIIDQIESYNIEPKTTNIINIVNYGAKDGQVVNTSFENAFSDTNLASGGIVYVPAGHYYIDGATHTRSETYFYEPDNGIKIPSNITLFLNPDAILETKSNSNFCSTQFKIDNASNVNIIGGSFVGDRKTHVIDQTTKFQRQDHYAGECGFGIVTAGAKNVRITHTSFTGFWGDGINVFYDEDLVVDNSEIEIDHVTFDSNRRQGISVENGDQLKIHHNTFKNTGIAEQLNGQLDNSTPPRAGIDLEPSDGNFDGKLKHVTNVTIENNDFDCNVGPAVMINVARNDRTPLSVKGVLIQHNTVNNNSKWTQGQFHICGGTDVEIAYNKITKNTPDSTMTGVGQAIWVGWTTGLNIHNNYLPGGALKLEPFGNITYYANQTMDGIVKNNYALGFDISDDWYLSVTQSNNLQSSDAPESFIQLTGIDPNSDKDDTHIISTNHQAVLDKLKPYEDTIKINTNKIINVHDRGIIGDGITDQRKALQSILDEIDQASGGIIYLPAGTYMVNSISQDSKYSDPQSLLVPTAVQGLQMHSNTTLLMDKDASLKAIPNKYWNYLVLNALHVENVNVLGGSIIGDRPNHDMSNPNMTWNNSKGFNSPYYGEWGTGFSSSHSNHVNVFNVHFKDFWGDGISLFAENAEANSGAESQANNVHISYCTFNHNRRQGISVGHANNVEIDHSIFANTNGTGPGAGIDLEPGGGSTEVVENTNIHDNVFINNNNAGITAYATSKSHVRNIHIYNNTFVDNSAWIPGQLVTNQVEGVEIDHNKFINNEASRWHSMWIMSTSNMNIHDNYGQNSAIDISSDNPASGFPSPSGSVHDNYISYVVIEHTGIQSSNNKLPDELSVNSINNYGAHLSYTRDTNDSEVLTTNEKVTFTGFNSHGTPLNVTDNPDSTVLNFWDTISWTADISFDIDAKYLNNKGDSDNTIRYSTPLWSMVHVPDYTPAIGSSDLLLGNAGVPVTIDGIKVAQMYANYMVSTGNFKGSGIQHVTVHGVNFGDGTWKNKPGTKTIITTADGKKYGYTFKNSDGTLPNVINNQLISIDNINPTPDENPFTITPSAPSTPSTPSSSTPSTPSTPSSPSSSTPPKPVEPAKYNLTISLIDRDSSQVKTNYKITKTEGEPITITLGMVESLLPQHYTFVPHALDNFPQTITLNGDSDTTVFITPIIDTINNTKQVTRTIIGQWFDTNGNIISSSTLKVQTAEFTTPTYVNEVTGQRTIGNSSPDNTTFPAYAIPPTKGYTAETAEVSSLTVFSTSNDTLVTVKYNKNRPPIVVEPPKPTTITNNFTVSVALPKLEKQTAFSISIKGSGVLHQISNADHTKLVTYDFNLNPNWYQRVEFMLDKQDAQNLELTFQNATDSVYLKLPKLEYGSTSTPYSE